jgi:hypothetical protein
MAQYMRLKKAKFLQYKNPIMKTMKICGLAVLLVLFGNISQAQPDWWSKAKGDYQVLDLYNGEPIEVYYDTVTWRTVNVQTKAPVDYYVIRYKATDMKPDTVHGITGIVVNDLLMKNAEGKWTLNDARVKWDGNEWKMKDKYGRKIKWEKGELKVKDWNSKYKAETGKETEAKFKEEWDKIKWKDGDVKTEIGTQKTKVKSDR